MNRSSETDFAYPGTELDAMAQASNYYRWIFERFAPHLGPAVMEVGAGIGTFSERLARAEGVDRLTLVEPDPDNARVLRERFRSMPQVQIREGTLEAGSDPRHTSLILVNVLEHVEDDLGFLRLAADQIEPDGRLLIFVPAISWLFGTLDQAFGHRRRYTPDELHRLLREAGFRVEDLRYTNPVGVVSWFAAARLLRKTTLTPREVRTFDRAVVPWLRRLERRWRPPIGQNLIAIASRPTAERR